MAVRERRRYSVLRCTVLSIRLADSRERGIIVPCGEEIISLRAFPAPAKRRSAQATPSRLRSLQQGQKWMAGPSLAMTVGGCHCPQLKGLLFRRAYVTL